MGTEVMAAQVRHSVQERPSALLDTASPPPVLSVVAPAFNEAECLPAFFDQLRAVMDALGEPWELVLVNDGSRDGTLRAMRDLRDIDPRIAVIDLSRNFGKEIATTAGLDHARGQAVILIDA